MAPSRIIPDPTELEDAEELTVFVTEQNLLQPTERYLIVRCGCFLWVSAYRPRGVLWLYTTQAVFDRCGKPECNVSSPSDASTGEGRIRRLYFGDILRRDRVKAALAKLNRQNEKLLDAQYFEELP